MAASGAAPGESVLSIWAAKAYLIAAREMDRHQTDAMNAAGVTSCIANGASK